MSTPLRVLFIEDSEDDMLLLMRELRRGGYEITAGRRVDTATDMRAALADQQWDAIIADYTMPGFSGLEALRLFKESGLDLPFIVVSGTIGEEVAVLTMLAGAHDYIMKGHLTRLVPAIQRELREVKEREARRQAESALRESEERFRSLVENSLVGIFLVDENYRFIYANDELCRLTGYTREEITGLDFRVFLEEEYREFMTAPYLRRIEGETVPSHFELKVVRRDGERRWVSVIVNLTRDPAGNSQTIGEVLDITDSKRAEAALRASEAKYRALFESSPETITVIGLDGVILDTTAKLAPVTGLAREQFPGMPFLQLDMLRKEDLPGYMEAFARLVSGEEVGPLELQMAQGDREIWLEVYPALLRTDDGEVYAIQVISRDITERKHAEKALQEYAGHLQILRELDQAILAAKSPVEIAQAALSRVRKLLPCVGGSVWLYDSSTAEAVSIAMDVGTSFSVPPGTRIPLPKVLEKDSVFEKLQRGEVLVFEDFRDLSQVLPIAEALSQVGVRTVYAFPLISGQQLTGILALGTDGSEVLSKEHLEIAREVADLLAIALKQAQLHEQIQRHTAELEQRVAERTAELRQAIKRVETILDSSPDAILLLKADGTIETSNRGLCDLFGYQLAEMCGQTPVLLADSAYTESFGRILSDALQKGEKGRLEIVARHKDGRIFDADTALAPVRQDNIVTGLVCSVRDISALKEVERMKDDFVSNVSHELRTPITNLKLYHQLLVNKPAKQDAYMARLERETDRLARIIEDLLSLSRMDQGRTTFKLRPTDLNMLAAQYIDDRASLAEAKGLSLSFHGQPNLPSVQGDPGLLEQAMGVLLANAINYTPEHGQIRVRTQMTQMNGRSWVGLEIKDDGPGIPLDEQPRLFERFYRGTAARESGAPGTGLGLSIAREIVERHGGWIEVVSEGVPGKGAAFSIWLQADKREGPG